MERPQNGTLLAGAFAEPYQPVNRGNFGKRGNHGKVSNHKNRKYVWLKGKNVSANATKACSGRE